MNLARRNCLKGALLTGVASGMLGISGTKVAAANPVNCVRSPWAYYHLSQNLSGTGDPTTDFGNESLPKLLPLTNDPTQWKSVFWVGNGIDQGLQLPWLADPVGLDAAMVPSRNAWLLGVEIFHPEELTVSEIVYSAGQRYFDTEGVSTGNLVELKINVNGRFTMALWDDNGQRLQAAIPTQAGGPGSSRLILFVYVDHRAGGPEIATIYQYTAGTTQRRVSSVSIAELATISGGVAGPEKYLTVGVGRNVNGNLYKHFNGWIRGLNVLNFGNRPPADLDVLLDEMSVRRLVPGTAMEGI
jgi:hypothetical protein